jgi:hypothetical protein
MGAEAGRGMLAGGGGRANGSRGVCCGSLKERASLCCCPASLKSAPEVRLFEASLASSNGLGWGAQGAALLRHFFSHFPVSFRSSGVSFWWDPLWRQAE